MADMQNLEKKLIFLQIISLSLCGKLRDTWSDILFIIDQKYINNLSW